MSDRTNNPAAWPDSKVAHACAFFAAALESMLVRERSFMANPDLEVAADECLQRICTEQGLDPRAWRVVLVAYTYPTYQVTVSERSAIDRLGDVVR